MAANYLHGVETIELKTGQRVIRVVKSSVIGLLGVSMYGPAQALTIVQSSADAAQFGPANVSTGNIASTLDVIAQQGGGLVVVANVFDATKHLDSDTITVEYTGATKINPFTALGVLPYNNVTYFEIVNTTPSTPVDLVMGTDYTLNNDGDIVFISTTNVTVGDDLDITYNTVDYSLVTDPQWTGTVTGVVKTGSKLFENCYQLFGFTPKIWINPSIGATLGTSKPMADLLLGLANKYRGHALIDGASTLTPQTAITSRGNVATPFGTSDKRAVLLYPVLNPSATTYGATTLAYSAYFAGVMAYTDYERGYWVSPSNKEIKSIIGSTPAISSAINDPLTEANLLNESGIVTVFNSFGTGLRTWGNRSAAFPASTFPDNFICVQRTADIIHESVELAQLQVIDEPINNALIDSIKDTVNGFLNDLVMRGAIIDGVCTFDSEKNTPTVLGAGHLIFDITFMPPTPAERITFESFIDIQLLQSLTGTNV